MKERKRITAKEIREMGLLWKINRDILHPLGLALETLCHDDGTETFGGVWDLREEDSEGFEYGNDLNQQGFEKYQRYMEAEGRERYIKRERLLGYVEQPLPEEMLE